MSTNKQSITKKSNSEIIAHAKKQAENLNIDYTKITFVKPEDDFGEYTPKKQINTYYQICQFKSKFTKKYETRKIVFNELGDILKIYEREYSYEELNIFMKHHRQNKFKVYPVNDIKQVEMPTSADIICCQSELLNTDNQNYDFKNF